MAVYSMTGYAGIQQNAPASQAGAESRNVPGQRLGLEIRSVNSRFLDLSFRLSDELRQHEPALRELITRKLTYNAGQPASGTSAKLAVRGATYTVAGTLASAENGSSTDGLRSMCSSSLPGACPFMAGTSSGLGR